MKVAFILRSVTLTGGIERAYVDKANWLAGKGHQVTLLTYEQGNHPMSFPLRPQVRHIDLDCRYFTIYQHHLLSRPILIIKMKQAFRKKLRSFIDTSHPDVIVIPHNLGEFQHEILPVSPLVRIVYEMHSTSIELFKGNTYSKWLYRHSLFRGLKKADLIITLTQGDALFWRKHFNNVKTVPNSLPSYVGNLADNEKITGRILFAGRLHPVKRVDRLIQAFALIASKYPQWHIDIYGEGEEKAHIEQLIQDSNLSKQIKINEPVRDINIEYRRSQFLVLCSDSESFSLVIIEAMANGIPVVSTDCPYGPREIIDDQRTGLLSHLDAADLAAKMEWMMTHNQERAEMGRKAQQAATRFSRENVMAEWEKAYLSVL